MDNKETLDATTAEFRKAIMDLRSRTGGSAQQCRWFLVKTKGDVERAYDRIVMDQREQRRHGASDVPK